MRVGRAEVSRGALLLLAWLLYRDTSGMVFQCLAACLLHEAAHFIVMRLQQIRVKRIRITIFGAQIILGDSMSYTEEAFCAAAGPGMNLLLAALCCRSQHLQSFAGVNLALCAFNLLPIGDLDGARILRCLLAQMLSDRTAAVITRCLDISFTVIFSCAGLYLAVRFYNPTLFFVTFWLFYRMIREKKI